MLLLLIWELWICEGAHLGRRVVVWLYDLASTRYDGIKQFDPAWERQFLGEPLGKILANLSEARLLDVGAGTARTFRALEGDSSLKPLDHSQRNRLLVGLEPSRRMIDLGRKKLDQEHAWLQGVAVPLPIASDQIDVAVARQSRPG